MKCTVIFQCAVMCLMQQERTRVGVGPVLRGGEIGGGCLQAQKATAGTPRIPGTTSVPRPGTPRILIADFFSQASHSAGGGAQGTTPGPCSDLLHEAGRAHHVESFISHSPAVPEEAKREPSLGTGAASSEGDHGGGCLQRAWSSSRTSLQRGGFLLESQGARMAGSCGGVEVPVLGQCGKTPGGGQIEKAAHRSGGVGPLAEACKASADPGPGSSLRMQAETVGDNGRDGHVPHGPVHSDTPKLGGMAFSTGSAGLHGVTAGRHRIPQGEFQAQPGNRQNQRDDPLAMMLTSRLILTNRSQNICYMNSVVQVCHWLLQLRPTRVALMGTGKVFFDALQ